MTVCLTMVVKNEAHVLARSLASVKGLVDSYVILVDDSTEDASERVVSEILRDVSGICVRRLWLGFSRSRNAAIDLAADADYLLTLDADDHLELPPGFVLPPLRHDGYSATIHDGVYGSEIVYPRVILFKNRPDIRYEGVVHERIVGLTSVGHLEGVRYVRTTDGASWGDIHGKNLQRAAALEAELREHPDDTHSMFYAAQCWRDASDSSSDEAEKATFLNRAIAYYRRRTRMRSGPMSDDDEVFYSFFMLGKLLRRKNEVDAAGEAYRKAATANPSRRAEAHHDLMVMLRETNLHRDAYEVGQEGLWDPMPKTGLFVDTSIYRWRFELEFATTAWWAGHREEARHHFEALLRSSHTPPEERVGLRRSLTFCVSPSGSPLTLP